MRAIGRSVAGFTVANVSPDAAGTNSPPMNRPYSSLSEMWSVLSGAGSYCHPESNASVFLVAINRSARQSFEK